MLRISHSANKFKGRSVVLTAFCVLDVQEALVPAPTRVSPAPTTEQKHNQKNDQNGSHVSTSLVGGSLLTRLAPSVTTIVNEIKMDSCLYRDTFAFLIAFSVTTRQLIVWKSPKRGGDPFFNRRRWYKTQSETVRYCTQYGRSLHTIHWRMRFFCTKSCSAFRCGTAFTASSTYVFGSALLSVWQQFLIDKKKSVKLDGERCLVRRTSNSKLKQIDFRF
jgi:hypothetical protein